MAPTIAPKATPASAAPVAPQPRRMFVFGAGFVGRYVSERSSRKAGRSRGRAPVLPRRGSSRRWACALPSSMQQIAIWQLSTVCRICSSPFHPFLGWVILHIVNPKTESAKLRHAAEKGWLDLIDGPDLSAFVFRLGGIYGPGRSALDTIAKSKSLSQRQQLRESKQYTAQIHVADIYQAVLASMSIRCARKIIDVVDDDPAPRAEVFSFARSLIESRYPDLISESIEVDSTGLGSRGRVIPAEKRVSNVRLKQELGVKLLHPTYRSGIQSILDSWQDESMFPDRSR